MNPGAVSVHPVLVTERVLIGAVLLVGRCLFGTLRASNPKPG